MQIEAYWNGLFDTRWEDIPLGPEAIRLVTRLRGLGYCERTRRMYGTMVVHFGRFLASRGKVNVLRLNEHIVGDFIKRHLPVCGYYRRFSKKNRYAYAHRALEHLLAMLRDEGIIPPVKLIEPPYHTLLGEYCHFLLQDRGLAQRTVATYRGFVRNFLEMQTDKISPADLVRLTSDDLLSFSHKRAGSLSPTSWNHLALSLSSFYRWLELRGYEAGHLVRVIPLRRRYRLADVPCALSWDKVQRILATVDRERPDGRRNYAMLLLIATYGLRDCEVRTLRLENIDWKHNEITILVSKTGRELRLPLTRPVGDAILDYLQHERPTSIHREVFLSRIPPQGPLGTGFYKMVARCFKRAGVDATHCGAHTLRHSLAIHLLRHGETLKGIGDLLGHRSVETTFMYTKLHVEDLREVALDLEVVS